MTIYKTYHPKFSNRKGTTNVRSGFVLLVFFMLFSRVQAKETLVFKDKELNPIISFDEIPVEIIIKGYGSIEVDVIITESNLLYIDIADLFKKLGILCVENNNGNILTGFIENESKPYLIDFNEQQITVGKNTIHSQNGIVKELNAIYIESTILTEAFGLTMIFNYRSLSIKLEANFELPLVKQMRLEKIRQNVSKLQNKVIEADTIVSRNYHLFKFGMMDWSLASYQTQNEKTTNRFGLGLGAELLHGEANVSINYDDQYKFDERQLYYNWRWIDNDKKYIKQAQVGKIYNQSISFLSAPVVGASITNSPSTVRKASGFYTITEYTEPNWTVELYINDVLVDFTAADASGLYEFKVPNVYGYTTLKLKFYGPLGEERTEERTMNTPYTFMPAKTLEYSVSGGVLQDEEDSQFGRGILNYGVNRFLTVGAGLEYLSSIPDNPYIPFANLAFQPFSKMVLNFEYAYDVRLKGLLNYYFGKSAFLELDYAKYKEGQLATRFNANEERKIRVSVPFKWNKISGYTKLNYNQFVYSAFNYNQFNWVLSGYYKNFNANSTTLINWVSDKPSYTSTNLMLSYRMRNGFVLRPSTEYNVTENEFMRFKAEIEKRVAKMYFSASYERNVVSKTDNVFLSFRYDLPFARIGLSSTYSNNKYNFSESAQGSLAFGGDNGYVHAGNNSALGKGGILFYPFLDLNQNGKRDEGEQMILLSSVRVTGGKAIISEKDSIVRISDLNAFVNYNVEFSDTDLENISWRFKHNNYQVLIDPNQYKPIDVPVIVMGEVSGMVYFNENSNQKGLGRITLHIINNKGKKVAETLTETDGYFSYLGLKPGEYSIRIDEQQLEKLGYQSVPLMHKGIIKVTVDGDILEGLDFTLRPSGKITEDTIIRKDTVQEIPTNIRPDDDKLKSKIDSSFKKVTEEKELFYSVKIGEFKDTESTKHFIKYAPIFYEVMPNGNIAYMSGKYTSVKDAANAKNGMMLGGIKNAVVVAYDNGERIDLSSFATPDTTKNNTIKNSNANTSFGKIADIKEFFYSVQIGVFRKYVTVEQLLNLNPIFYEILPNGTTQYLSGKYDFRKEAKTAKNRIVAIGIKDAYVVAYQNGQKLDAASLRKIENTTVKIPGKISGTIKVEGADTMNEIGNLSISLQNKNGIKVGKTTTDDKGNYSFPNLNPGEYSINIDETTLKKLNYRPSPLFQNVTVKTLAYGDLKQGIDFVLIKINN